MAKPKTAAYLRVSTDEQYLAKNRFDILHLANEKGRGKVAWVEETVTSRVAWKKRKISQVQFMRNVLALVPHGEKALVSALLRTIFTQPSRMEAEAQWQLVYEYILKRWPQAALVMADARDDMLAYILFPAEHWTRIYSTNPLERLNKEVKRRTNVVGVFPDPAVTIRLAGAVSQEIDDEWQVGQRYFSLESMPKVHGDNPTMTVAATPRLAPVFAPIH